MTDPIADMLTRMRNALTVRKEKVEVPASNMKKEIARILLEEGYVSAVDFVENEHEGVIVITLKYAGGKSVIGGLQRISKPGLRSYTGAKNMPKVLEGYGIAIISTNKGIMTDKKAKALGVGGEVLCYVY